ncbi:response regulator transcription factor [Desmospora activa]|uniref:DNA-binding response OmpR family regulator n=1 Tax=Desmospora activa DSM 45169 TaxID=1121389 RepID=A0A2T4ZBX4_9BACL|nr:response regulator transcription factor [Desmospora activa]PTM59377.1 DNA-binding response OmpR family regulator [Desmospora activa DSM 45169]
MHRPTTILIVDDDPEIRRLIKLYLENEGFTVIEAKNGVEALELVEKKYLNLIVLDRMMPGIDGVEVCMRLRDRYQMPIIMLTAKTEDIDKIEGLTVGADDYVTKPFNPLELVARIKAQLRRSQMLRSDAEMTAGIIQLQHLTIDPERRQVLVEEKPVRLTPREFDILYLLAQRPGVVFPSEDIYERVWGEPMLTNANTVMVHIRKIREKVELDPRRPTVIQTVWGVGYKAEQSPDPGRA